jgi:basic membrane protein A and related proteins
MESLIGKELGRYRILEQLGEGGMATVYKAYDMRLERDVAVKIIRIDQFAPAMLDRVLKRFEREAKALARLTHPNIVHVNDYGEHEGVPYLVMDYIPGGTLKLSLGKPMPWQEAMRLLVPIAEALEYAHEHNVIHRDIKPSNILLTEKSQPMLSDFGIAKILEGEESATLSVTGTGVGTPEYMAPEQWIGKAGPLADLYSLGVVLFELVTGRKPYTADTPAAIMLKQATDPLPRPRQFVPDLPEEVEKVLFKALAKSPEDRYQSMGEFTAAIDKVLASGRTIESVEKPKEMSKEEEDKTLLVEVPEKKIPEEKKEVPVFSKAGQRAGKWGRWLPWGVGAVVLVAAAVIIGLLVQGSGGHLSPPPPTATPLSTTLPVPIILPTIAPTAVLIPTATATPKIKVGEVTDLGGVDDKSFNALAWKGVTDAISQLGVDGKYLESSQQSDYVKNINQMLTEHQDLIITVGFLLGVDTASVAKANPDQKFAIVDYTYPDCYPGAVEGKDCGSSTDLANVRGLAFQTDQAAFLAGYLAAGMTKTGKVASFGGVQIPTVTIFMKGFQAGVKYYNQKHGTTVQALGWDDAAQKGLFTGNFTSTDDGRSFATSLVQEGADIVMPVAGPVGLGSAAYCQTSGKCLIIGVDTDWFVSANEYASVELSSVQKKMDVAVFKTIQDFVNGRFAGGTVTYTLKDGGVDLAPYHNFDSQVTQALKNELTQLRADIISGAVTIDGVLGK